MWDPGAGWAERVACIPRVQADRHTDVDRAVAGDIVTLAGVKGARSGATLCAVTDGERSLVGLRVTLTDGRTHPKDSSELAFRAAGRFGPRAALAALAACELALLEPVAEVTVQAPPESPAELFGYATRLRSRTQGRGTFPGRPAGYRPAA